MDLFFHNSQSKQQVRNKQFRSKGKCLGHPKLLFYVCVFAFLCTDQPDLFCCRHLTLFLTNEHQFFQGTRSRTFYLTLYLELRGMISYLKQGLIKLTSYTQEIFIFI